MNEAMTTVPFGQLVISEQNVRTINPDKAKDKELLASIRARGILQNLIVHPAGKSKFGVSGGGRRFACLTVMHEAGEITEDTPIPVKKAESEKQARDWSLAENSGRADMHPADQFLAFQALAEDGHSVPDIARNFGVAKAQVTRLLKLATVAPALIKQFAKGIISLDEMQAFALSDSQDDQLAVFESLKEWERNPQTIRKLLTPEAVTTDNRLARFVSVAAYKKAGGAVTADLFENTTYLNDLTLLGQLAKDKLAEAAKAYEGKGWKWVECDLERFYVSYGDFAATLNPDPESVPAELRDKMAAMEKEVDALQDKDDDQWTVEDGARMDELENVMDELDQEINDSMAYSPEDMADSGVLVLVDRKGEADVFPGLMTKDDMAERQKARAARNPDGERGTATGEPQRPEPVESQALSDDLQNYRLQAVQAELLNHPNIAYDLMVFHMAEQVLGEFAVWSHPLTLTGGPESLHQTRDIEETKAAAVLGKDATKVDSSWLQYEDRGERFAAFQGLSKKAKQAIMTHCVAMNLTRHMGGMGDELARAMDFNLRDYWTPTAANYFGRVKAKNLLNIGKELISAEWAKQHANTKKGELAGLLAEASDVAGWLPDSMQ